MRSKKPPFEITNQIIDYVAEIAELVGRLWHTLLLSKWNPAFAWLPVESIIHDHQ